MFLAVTMVAMACAALVEPTHWFLRSIVTISITLYAVTAVRIIALRGSDRVFAVAFCAFGIGYLILVSTGIGRLLFTNYPMAEIALAKQMSIPSGPVSYSAPRTRGEAVDEVISNSMLVPSDTLPVARLFLIGHCVWSWLFALLGGWFAGSMYARRNSPNAS
jgi:hypothetical protein